MLRKVCQAAADVVLSANMAWFCCSDADLADRLDNNSSNNNSILCIYAGVFTSASRLQQRRANSLEGIYVSSGYIPISAIPPDFFRTLHMRGAQSAGATNAL